MKLKKLTALIIAAMISTAAMIVPADSPLAVKAEAAEKGAAINKKNFPDRVFRDYIKKQFDIDKNGILSSKELALVTSIDLFGGDCGEVCSLKGIEYFTELRDLNCTAGSFRTLDLRYNKKLVRLECGNCGIEKLNIKNNKRLKYLDIRKNSIKTLDLSNNRELIYLDCTKAGSFTLDLRNNKKLEELHMSYIGTELDLTNNPEMKILDCVEGDLERIDVTSCRKLRSLKCAGNNLNVLDLSSNDELEELFCDPDVIIYCKEDSFAEEYAEENGIDYLIV